MLLLWLYEAYISNMQRKLCFIQLHIFNSYLNRSNVVGVVL